MVGPVLEVDSDFLEKEGDRVVSALAGGRAERSWALNALCLLSCKQDLRLSATPGLLPALLPVLQEGLATAVGLGTDEPCSTAADLDELRRQQGLPPLPGWQRRRAERACQGLFPDRQRLEERLQEAAAAAVVLRNAAEVQQNSALLLDPPVMRCWTWALDAARELVQQQMCAASCSSSWAGGDTAGGSSGRQASGDGGGDAAHGMAGRGSPGAGDGSEGGGAGSGGDDGSATGGLVGPVVGTGGTAADICTTLLQMVTVLSGRMLLPAFFECGMLLLRSLLILMRPSWQHAAAAAGGAALPPPIVSLAVLAVTAVATAYQPNTDILLSMTGAPNGGRPGATLMQVIADLLICPFEVFRQHAQQQVDEDSPGWRLLLPTDAELLTEAKRSSRAGKLAAASGSLDPAAASGAAQESTTAELCTLDMMAVLSQLRYLSSLLHLLWRLLTAAGTAGAQARAAVAGCPRLLATLCEIAVHRWPQHPARWHADCHAQRHPDAYPAYLRFLSHDMMPAMRERQELLQPLRADAAALLALLAADPETRPHMAWCEGQLVTSVMLGVVPASEPGISALLARFAAQGATGPGGSSGGPDSRAGPQPMAGVQQQQQEQRQAAAPALAPYP
ncbi:hypothetical protein ABPG75_001248 [Micractinium tetrahymenae]